MASEWGHTRIGQVAHRVTKGTTPTTIGGQFTERGIAFVKAESITDDGRIDQSKLAHIDDVTNELLSRSVLNEEDILFTIAGTIGRVAMVPYAILPANTNQAVAIIRPNRSVIEPRYLYYALRDKQRVRRALTRVVQSVQANLSLTELSETQIPLPSIQEQRAIAHILGTLDDKIELNRRMNQTLEAMAQALFKSWFVDFEPFRDQGMQDSALGEIPAGWRTEQLDKVADFLNGLALQKYPPEGEDYLPVIKIAELRRGVNESSGRASPFISKEYIVEDGDILFSWSGSLEVCIWCGGKGALNQHLFKVTSTAYPKWFYYHWTRYHLPEFQAIAAGKATTMGHIQRYHLSSALVVIPPKNVLETMDKMISPLLDSVINNNLESRILAATRDTLLPKLLSGEIRVKDARNFQGRYHEQN